MARRRIGISKSSVKVEEQEMVRLLMHRRILRIQVRLRPPSDRMMVAQLLRSRQAVLTSHSSTLYKIRKAHLADITVKIVRQRRRARAPLSTRQTSCSSRIPRERARAASKGNRQKKTKAPTPRRRSRPRVHLPAEQTMIPAELLAIARARRVVMQDQQLMLAAPTVLRTATI